MLDADHASAAPPPPAPARGGRGPRRRRTRLAPWIALAVLAAVAVLVVVLATSDPAVDRVSRSPLLGKPSPAIAGPTLTGGSYDLVKDRNRWVVVNFFATWCPPCQKEHPELLSFDQRHRQSGDARLISVTFDPNDLTDAKAFFAQKGGDWPVVADAQGAIAASFGIAKVPETWIIDPSGFVVRRIAGEVTASGLDRILAGAEAEASGALNGAPATTASVSGTAAPATVKGTAP